MAGEHRLRGGTKAKVVGAAAVALPLIAAGSHADEAAAKAFTVKSKADHGRGSLRQAITRANRHNGKDRIVFRSRLSGAIAVRRDLTIAGPLKIDGPGRRRLALRGPKRGTRIRFLPQRQAKEDNLLAIHDLTLKAVSVGASSLDGGVDLRIVDSRLSGQGMDEAGVDFYDGYGGDLLVTRSRVKGFRTGVFAGYHVEARINRSVISHNGVGADSYRSRIRIDKSVIKANGTGVSVGYYGGASITKSTITGNVGGHAGYAQDGRAGAGLWVGYGSASVVNSTISGNTAVGPGSRGGGLYGSDIEVMASTVTGNTAEQGGGVAAPYEDSFGEISDSIVAGNSSAVGPDDCGAGLGSSSKGGNVFGPDGCGANPDPTDIFTADPGLGPLADNGGPTPTHALLPGSPAINHAMGLELAADQRGVRRDRNPDSGSFERR